MSVIMFLAAFMFTPVLLFSIDFIDELKCLYDSNERIVPLSNLERRVDQLLTERGGDPVVVCVSHEIPYRGRNDTRMILEFSVLPPEKREALSSVVIFAESKTVLGAWKLPINTPVQIILVPELAPDQTVYDMVSEVVQYILGISINMVEFRVR